jgi:SRSO17 transposase
VITDPTTGSARALLDRLGTFMDGFSDGFSRRPQRKAASQYIDALFNDSERKSMEAMHGRLSDPISYEAWQHFMTDSPWEAAPLWTHLRRCVPVRRGLLALDDTGFPKHGTKSVGVQRQDCGALGKIGHCQVAVSSALLAEGRTWPLTFELYLPHVWTADPPRCAAAGIPDTVRFREKWRIALAHVRTVLKAGFEVAGVVVDTDYGANAAFRAGLERLGLRYAVAIRGHATFWRPGGAAGSPRHRHRRRRAGHGLATRHVGDRDDWRAEGRLLRPARPRVAGARRAVAALRAIRRRRPEILPAQS